MILKMFAVRDMKAQAFLQPFYSPSTGSALRAFGDAAQDGTCPFSKHPEDYVLYEIATYDDATAEIVSVVPMRMLACAADFASANYKEKSGARGQLPAVGASTVIGEV